MNGISTQLILETMTEGIQENTVGLLAIVSILQEKGIITKNEYEEYKEKELKEIEIAVEKAIAEIQKKYDEEEESAPKKGFSWFGKAGEA
jgi:hypothetical protein